jgi:hypothetical protein
MRTYEQLIAEIQYRKEMGLPRIELTSEEKARAFGDVNWAKTNRSNIRMETMIDRYRQNLPLSREDKKEVKKYLKNSCAKG